MKSFSLISFLGLIFIWNGVVAGLADQSSLSNFETIKQTHLNLNITIDFDKKTFEGIAEFEYQALSSKVNEIVLDTDALNIIYVTTTSNEALVWYLDEDNSIPSLGTPLVVRLKSPLEKNGKTTIRIYYSTSQTKTSIGIQWMTPDMTFGKKYPFVFTQGQAIHARSIYPVQDTPSVKFTVNAALRVKKLYTALLAGVSNGKIDDGQYTTFLYKQTVPIQSYLVAIAVGADMEYRKLGDRTGVWAEKAVIEKAVIDFADTESFIKTGEGYLTPYEWQVYNILVVPAGFPYGGMENPCLTFATPSLLAGDKSLGFVIAHEISHSWTGNLVTNKNWRNFWLNEGFTVFTQRKISEIMYGEDMANLEALVQYKDLVSDIIKIGVNNTFTSLYPNVGQKDPDDAFSQVPYQKGETFLYYLQSLVKKDKFQVIMQEYIKKYRLQSIGWEDWQSHFNTQVKALFPEEEASAIISQVDWDSWIMKPGYPPVTFNYKSKFADEVNTNIDTIFNMTKLPDNFNSTFRGWHTNLKMYFLNRLTENLPKVSTEIYNMINNGLNLSSTEYNMEIQNLWLLLSLKLGKREILGLVNNFLAQIGRMKFIRPIYIEYNKIDRTAALKVFNDNIKFYSPIAIAQIKKDINITTSENEIEVNKFLKRQTK